MEAGRLVSLHEAAERAGLSTEAAEWALVASGITIPDADVAFVDEHLLSALGAFAAAAALFGEAAALQFSRVLGAAAAKLADAANGLFVSEVLRSTGKEADVDGMGPVIAGQIPIAFAGLFPRHLDAAVERDRVTRRIGSFETVEVAIGFVDIVGSTEWAQHLSPIDHANALLTFESAAWGTAMRHGGRVVKLIGDEAMLVAADLDSLCLMALDLCEAVSDDPHLPPARGAVGRGEVVARDGDYFGPLVNLVSRCVKAAPAGSVVAVEDAWKDLDPSRWSSISMAPLRARGIDGAVRVSTVTLVSG
jgi:adenylate cyclase